jgi:predicted ATPase
MRSLDRIKANGFKSIKEIDLELRKLNVLIGSNGVGKSNFIGLFKLLNNIVEGNLQVYVGSCGGAETLLHFGRKTTSQISLDLSFASYTNGYKCTLSPTADDTLIFKYEGCWYHYKARFPNPLRVSLGSGHKETKLGKATENRAIARHVLDDLKSWKVYHFHDTSDSARVKQTGDLEDNRVLRPDAGNLAAFLYRLKEKSPSHYRNIVDSTRLVFPFFDDFVLEPSALNPDKIRLEWRENGSDAYFNASALSDGTLRFICLSTLLLQPYLPTAILLDEPELGLHPYAITIIAELLRGAATKTQVIVSTQSVSLVNQFEPEDIVVVEREERHSVFRRLDKSDMQSWLDDYGLGDLWEKNIIGGRP